MRNLTHSYDELRSIVARLANSNQGEIDRDTSIVDELNLDSLRLLDLTFAIEDAFEIDEFPMQQWYDAEAKSGGKRFTIGSLLSACERVSSATKASSS